MLKSTKEHAEQMKSISRLLDFAQAHDPDGGERKNLYLERAVKVCPYDEEKLYKVGQRCLDAGMPNEAIEVFKDANKINPKNRHTHASLGEAYMNVGHSTDAIKSLKKAIKMAEKANDNKLATKCERILADHYESLGFTYNGKTTSPQKADNPCYWSSQYDPG